MKNKPYFSSQIAIEEVILAEMAKHTHVLVASCWLDAPPILERICAMDARVIFSHRQDLPWELVEADVPYSQIQESLMHHKFYIFGDCNGWRSVLQGSYNGTCSSRFHTDSMTLLYDEDVVQGFVDEFERLFPPTKEEVSMSYFSDIKNNISNGYSIQRADSVMPANTECLAYIEDVEWEEWEGVRQILIKWRVQAPSVFVNRTISQRLKILDPEKMRQHLSMLAAIDHIAGGMIASQSAEPSNNLLARALMNKPMMITLDVYNINGKTGNWVCGVRARQNGNPTPDVRAEDRVEPPCDSQHRHARTCKSYSWQDGWTGKAPF